MTIDAKKIKYPKLLLSNRDFESIFIKFPLCMILELALFPPGELKKCES